MGYVFKFGAKVFNNIIVHMNFLNYALYDFFFILSLGSLMILLIIATTQFTFFTQKLVF